MRYHSFEELLLQHAAEFPDRCALRFPSGGHCSYRELTQSVQQEAERRRASGKTCLGVLCDGTVVPCCLDHDGELALGNLLEFCHDGGQRSESSEHFGNDGRGI